MSSKIFVAGASGAIGQRLVPMLVAQGHRVYGLTRSAERAGLLQRLGATPVVGDVFDRGALAYALLETKPEVIIHQLTDLPRGLPVNQMEQGIRRNARIRSEGTANLVSIAEAIGVRMMVAQSIAWAYAPGDKPYLEGAPLDEGADGLRAISVAGVTALEWAVLSAKGVTGIVLRYGQIYGPGTGSDDDKGKRLPLSVDAAARAAVLALSSPTGGVFNIVGPNPDVCVDKAKRVLGWYHE